VFYPPLLRPPRDENDCTAEQVFLVDENILDLNREARVSLEKVSTPLTDTNPLYSENTK
jgi:hypothetical protein